MQWILLVVLWLIAVPPTPPASRSVTTKAFAIELHQLARPPIRLQSPDQ